MQLRRTLAISLSLVVGLVMFVDSAKCQSPNRNSGRQNETRTKKPSHRVAVTLKNNQVINGYFIQANDETLEIDSKNGHQQIKLDEIASISFTNDAQNTGWQPPPHEVVLALENAVKSLRKMSGAAAAKVTLKEYESRMIDTKVDVEDVLTKLPSGELKGEMAAALDAYVDAQQIWEEEVDFEIVMPAKDPLAAQMMKKYFIKPIEETSDPSKVRLDRDNMIEVMWRAAQTHVDKLGPLVSAFIFEPK